MIIKPTFHFSNIAAIVSAAIFLSSCLTHSDKSLKTVLDLAGDNRWQLQAVLDHYSDDPLKLEAAKFLIENMPGHYSFADTVKVNVFYNALDSLLDEMDGCTRKEVQLAIDSLYKMYDAGNFSLAQDVNLISSDFLIDNIDRAFDQWQNVAWCRSLDFDQFCELLLPYKVAETQALESYYDQYSAMFADSLQRMSSCSLFSISAFQATEVVNNVLRRHFVRDPEDYPIPPLYYRSLTRLRVPFGTCDELCQAGLTVFRETGIPVAIDYVPVWGYGNRGHSWGVVHAPNGKDMPFVPIFMSPYVQHKVNETVSKVYRRTYAHNEELLALNASQEWVPHTFRNVFQRDVTDLYTETCDVTVDVDAGALKHVYLCTSSRSQWKPVAFSSVNRGKATFRNVGKGCVFLVVCYDKNGEILPLTRPLKLDRDGVLSEIVANTDSLIDITLYRKAPLLEYAWNMAVKIENGEFEAADNPGFSNAVSIGRVETSADRAGEIDVDAGAWRYWRFIQRGEVAECFIGEISFVSGGEIKNEAGAAIGNYPGGDGLGDGHRAFDGDVLTAVSFSSPHEAWVGLDFGKPVSFDKIRYSPRSDGNMIEPGDEYELCYWTERGWLSLGRKIATTVSLDWSDVPSDGLYVLLNRTKGDSVRIFMIDPDGRQQWW